MTERLLAKLLVHSASEASQMTAIVYLGAAHHGCVPGPMPYEDTRDLRDAAIADDERREFMKPRPLQS